MEKELQRALTEMDELIKAWNNSKIAKEEDFIHTLKLVNGRIALLLPEPEKQDRQMRIT